MMSNELFKCLKTYFANNPELMKALKPGAIWEYIIRAPNLDDSLSQTILICHLTKKPDETLEMVEGDAPIKPDLILYFTEQAILSLIADSPSAEKYYECYRQIMRNPSGGIDLDYKINKSRLKLWQLGYRSWSKLYKFTQIEG
jgi:hypothetical protein